ncbi:MAG: hypothetical protein KatS3mg058_2397 [Roseiflexus sp.]|nr:MAG: hypothetical protein KatS3mg058_2397 [Roseiflexus sp.]
MTMTMPAIPYLKSGDRLTRAEFERRYEAMPHGTKAELIEGVVYVASPVRFTTHGEPHSRIITLLGIYTAATPGVRAGDNATVRLDWANEPQPDGLLRIERGASMIDADGYVQGPPEFVAEIAVSSAAQDMHDKLRVYRRSGVQEYLVWLVFEQRIVWFALDAGDYRLIPADPDAITRSRVFPGLWLDLPALVRDDMARALAALQQRIAAAEHAAFVTRLRSVE